MSQRTAVAIDARQMLNKVPEVTLWFWVIKILCTTVGESVADWINMTLGVGLVNTAVLFTAVLAVVLRVQLRLRRYVPSAYWMTVVVVSVTGTLYTDILTDQLGVPLWISTTVFSVMLTIAFATWWARERTLSIHSINTTPREGFYWFAVLVTFALGTATGDWTLELTGWGPGLSILLPLSLIALVTVLWRFGGDAVLCFWVAYILTRPLGANIGDWFGLPRSEQGLGVGVFGTSLIFLGAILATVVHLTVSKADVIETAEATAYVPESTPRTRRTTLGVMVAAAVSTVALLGWANAQPHQSALADEGPAPSCSGSAPLDQAQASKQVAADFPTSSLTRYRAIARDTRSLADGGDTQAAQTRIADLETAWDDDQVTLQSANCRAWTYVDTQIDDVLTSVRAGNPDVPTEDRTIDHLLTTLG